MVDGDVYTKERTEYCVTAMKRIRMLTWSTIDLGLNEIGGDSAE